jgi:hypothetical protein
MVYRDLDGSMLIYQDTSTSVLCSMAQLGGVDEVAVVLHRSAALAITFQPGSCSIYNPAPAASITGKNMTKIQCVD